jgi:hypothetical protein
MLRRRLVEANLADGRPLADVSDVSDKLRS